MHLIRVRLAATTLLDQGLSASEVARRTGVPRRTVAEWTRPADHVPGCPRCAGLSPVPAAPYAALLGFYLGDGCITSRGSRGVLRVSCDAGYPGIVADVSDQILAVRPGHRVFHVPAPGTVVVQANWKHWPCLFPQHGPGRKHERRLTLDDWQREIVSAYPAPFLRGLFHSDGCRLLDWARRRVGGRSKRYEYPRWHVTNYSPEIMRWCQEALDAVAVPWRQSSWKMLSVSTRDGVARLDALIGPKQ